MKREILINGSQRETRVAILEAKVKVAADEHALRTQESQEMTRRYKEADLNRFALLAELRRQGATRTLRGALGDDGGLEDDDFDRAADRITDDAAYADALDELVHASRLLGSDSVEVESLDDQRAREAGQLCGARGTADVIDASVVLCARTRGHRIVTSDPEDMRVLDPAAEVIAV